MCVILFVCCMFAFLPQTLMEIKGKYAVKEKN